MTSTGPEIQSPNNLAYVGSLSPNTSRDNWYTPAHIIEPIRSALGGTIDLDPFSSAKANATIQATRILTEEDDALSCDWPEVTSVFMNPPYSRGKCAKAVEAFLKHYEQGTFTIACVLTNNATETAWFQSLLEKSSAALFYNKRISFVSDDGKAVSNNTRGQVLFFFIVPQEGEVIIPHEYYEFWRFSNALKDHGTALFKM